MWEGVSYVEREIWRGERLVLQYCRAGRPISVSAVSLV